MNIKIFALLCALSLSSIFASKPSESSSPSKQTFAYILQRTKTVTVHPIGPITKIVTELHNDEGYLLVHGQEDFLLENGVFTHWHSGGLSLSSIITDDMDEALSNGICGDREEQKKMVALYHTSCEKFFGEKKASLASLEKPDASFHFNGTDFPAVFTSIADQKKKRSVIVITGGQLH